MKTKRTILLISLFFSALIFFPIGCKKDEDKKENGNNNQVEERDIYFFDVSNDTEWDYWAVEKNGGYMFFQEENEKPSTIYYKPNPEKQGYSIFLNNQGLPDKVVIENYIFLFANFEGNKVDVGVIFPNGEIEILRDIESEINWDNFKDGNFKNTEDVSDIFRWAGHVAGGAACVVGIATSWTGAGIPLVVIGCGSTLVGLVTEFLPEDFELLGLSATAVGSIATAIGCVGNLGVSCALGTASTTFSMTSLQQERIEEMDDQVCSGQAALKYGNGDVQVTLTWDNTSDLDLWVTDPFGEKIYWQNTSSSSGGQLDVDHIDGYGPENIYWPSGMAPDGTYKVQLDYYSGSGTANYTILLTTNNDSEQFQGSISPDQTLDITTFTLSKGSVSINKLNKIHYNLTKAIK